MRPSLAWLLRLGVALAMIALALIAIVKPQLVNQAAVFVAPPATPTLAAPPATPRATQTPQAITSIIVRETFAPYPTSTPFPANQPMVSIVDFAFMPGAMRISTGQTVMWHNDGTEQHDITGSDWHSGPLDPTYTYRVTFGVQGTYAYRCSIHLDMTGSVIVS